MSTSGLGLDDLYAFAFWQKISLRWPCVLSAMFSSFWEAVLLFLHSGDTSRNS